MNILPGEVISGVIADRAIEESAAIQLFEGDLTTADQRERFRQFMYRVDFISFYEGLSRSGKTLEEATRRVNAELDAREGKAYLRGVFDAVEIMTGGEQNGGSD